MYLILHIAHILSLFGLILYLTVKFKQIPRKYSLYWSVARYVFYRDRRGLNWISDNIQYVFKKIICIVIIILLYLVSITLIGQLLENSIFHRPQILNVIMPFVWSSLLYYLWYSDKHST